MLENINPLVAFGVLLAVVVGAKFMAFRASHSKPQPLGDSFGKFLAMIGEEGLSGVFGDVMRLAFNGDLAGAASKAESTLETLATPESKTAAMSDVFNRQLEKRLQDPEQRAKIAAKVDQYK